MCDLAAKENIAVRLQPHAEIVYCKKLEGCPTDSDHPDKQQNYVNKPEISGSCEASTQSLPIAVWEYATQMSSSHTSLNEDNFFVAVRRYLDNDSHRHMELEKEKILVDEDSGEKDQRWDQRCYFITYELLSTLNDSGWSFEQIAEVIEEQL